MTKSKLVGLDMPKDFPTGLQERVHERIIDSGRLATDAKSQFLGASSGLIYRFVQCAEHDEAFTASISKSDAPPQPERYYQERDLFGFFVSGLSALECLSFGLFAVGSALDSGSFPFRGPQDYGNVTPEKTARSFGRSFSGGQISATLNTLVSSPDYKEWKTVRNLLVHRAAPGRTIYARGRSTPPPQPGENAASWIHGVRLHVNTTDSRRRWLSAQIRNLLEATEVFSSSHLGVASA